MSDELTILIKCHSRPQCLSECIQSIRDHEGNQYKIVVCDDSNDHLVDQICATNNIELIKQPYDSGVCAGRNALVDHCETPWFLLLEEDMELLSPLATELLETIKDVNANYGELHMLGCDVHKRDSWRGSLSFNKWRTVILRSEHYAEYGAVNFVDLIPNVFVAKTEIVRKIRWDDELKTHEHLDYFFRAKRDGLIAGYDVRRIVKHKSTRPSEEYNSLRNRHYFSDIALRKNNIHSLKDWSTNERPTVLHPRR
jgi:glycosyltransferase involved in cell wall biosynthesis